MFVSLARHCKHKHRRLCFVVKPLCCPAGCGKHYTPAYCWVVLIKNVLCSCLPRHLHSSVWYIHLPSSLFASVLRAQLAHGSMCTLGTSLTLSTLLRKWRVPKFESVRNFTSVASFWHIMRLLLYSLRQRCGLLHYYLPIIFSIIIPGE